MNFLTDLLDGSTIPWITAILLGLLTAISPCPLATNITAIGYISKDIDNRKKVFLNGVFYTAGRAITYTGLAILIVLGADQFRFSGFFQKYGEKVIGPLLFIIGIFMLGLIRINLPSIFRISGRFESKKRFGYADALVLGLVLALAFCPYSGVLYFGMLIPLSVSSSAGLFLPVLFAVATAVPVIITAWLLAYMIGTVSGFYNRVRAIENWIRKGAAMLFMLTGIYYIVRVWFWN